jgi:hypothetical protein
MNVRGDAATERTRIRFAVERGGGRLVLHGFKNWRASLRSHRDAQGAARRSDPNNVEATQVYLAAAGMEPTAFALPGNMEAEGPHEEMFVLPGCSTISTARRPTGTCAS